MTDPMEEGVLTLADGRLLAWAEWGDPRGAPTLFFHPCPGSRTLCPDPAATASAGVRLITVDRPGYGRSDPVPDPTLDGFARDIERLLDHLWLGEVPVVGWSGGGQYAVACAAALAERVRALVLVATPAAEGQLRWLPAALQRVADLAKADPIRAFSAAVEWAAPLASAGEWAAKGWNSPLDLATRSRPGVERALKAMFGEALRAGVEGVAADVVALTRRWGCDLSQVRTPVTLLYGQQDQEIDPAHGRWWAQTLPRSRLTIRSDGGHLLPFVAWADILRAVSEPPAQERPPGR
ncbi:MAG: alpha/beta hydrolase [Acidimicrobiaceae bacterium]|nr:alpha/beta hydrolase [Acidimicrobiaceae bacterium]